jgi:hypothetical protein
MDINAPGNLVFRFQDGKFQGKFSSCCKSQELQHQKTEGITPRVIAGWHHKDFTLIS